MDQQPPDGYQEIGESLAQAVAEGLRGFRWGADLANLSGYTTGQFKQWLAYYREVHAKDLEVLDRQRLRRSKKISKWKKQSERLRKQANGLDR
jgi:hypothetical protein